MKTSSTDKIVREDKAKLEVALLISDLADVRAISAVFREAGIIPHFYETLKDLWSETLTRMPSLCVVDVKKMSEGSLSFASHPHVVSESMPVCFFYSDDSKPLVFSTYEIFNYGLIRKSNDYSGQIKSILKRFNKIASGEKEIGGFRQRNEKLERQFESSLQKIENHREKKFYNELLFNFCNEFEHQKSYSDDFFEACENAFSRIDEICEFSYLELSRSGHKLQSPASGCVKMKKIPSLWLGHACMEGVEFFAQNMANQVVLDIMGSDLMCLMIKGAKKNPDKMVFVRVRDEEILNNFNWEFFENYLGGIYSHFLSLNSQRPSVENGKIFEPWNLMGVLDRSFYENHENIGIEEPYVIDIDLTPLLEVIKGKSMLRFFWEEFLSDFTRKLENKIKFDYSRASVGLEHLVFVVEGKRGEIMFNTLKELVGRFQYWRYFEDSDSVFSMTISPQVRSVPVSSDAFLRHLTGVFLNGRADNSFKIPASKEINNVGKSKIAWSSDLSADIESTPQ